MFNLATRFYLRNTANGTANLPTTKQSTRSTVGNAQATTVNKNMLTTAIGTSQTSVAISIGSGYTYICRWVSDPIGQSSLAANTWTFSFGYLSFWGGSDAGVQVCIYTWRPGTGKITTIADTSVAQAFNSTETGYKLTVSGSAVASVTAGVDVICVEFMTNGSLAGGNANFYYDGTTAVTTNDTAASSCAAYIETPENINFGTRLYFHAAASSNTGTLPSAKQSTITASSTFDDYSVNRSMDTTIGISQTDVNAAKSGTGGSPYRMYMTRFLSNPIDTGTSSIVINTWTLSISAWASSTFPYYPSGSNVGKIPSCLYIWRPSNGTVVGNIFDVTASATATASYSQTSQETQKVTFTGSAVTVSTGDIIVFEAWTASDSASSYTYHYAFDGDTVNTVDNTAASSHAAFIETPQYLNLSAAGVSPGTVDATSTGKVNTNKIIIKA